MKKRCRDVTPAQDRAVTTEDATDQIIEIVAMWLLPGARMDEIRASPFYALVKERVRALAMELRNRERA
ncbi:MAG: hypothetical protein AB1665_05965 [Candidatus Thermoplasmatota archaeon]